MALDPCEPCECISGSLTHEQFYQKALQILCIISQGAGGGVPLGQAAAAASLPVVIATDQTSIPTSVPAVATGGAAMHTLISAATTNATSVKGGAATLYGIQVSNINAAVRYLKLYNKASAPIVGTDVAVKTIAIPGSTAGGIANISFGTAGVAFATGLAYALTSGVATADTGAVGAAEHVVNLDYK